jgi:hypothetical protein
MLSSIKKVAIAGVIAAGAVATLIPVQAHAADKNGWGIVYHKSDCGRWNVRQYALGGDGAGSSCGYWVGPTQRMIIHMQDHNWSQCDLVNVMTIKIKTDTLNYNNEPLWNHTNPTIEQVSGAVSQAQKCGY